MLKDASDRKGNGVSIVAKVSKEIVKSQRRWFKYGQPAGHYAAECMVTAGNESETPKQAKFTYNTSEW